MPEREIDRPRSESLKPSISLKNLITGKYFEEPDGSIADQFFE